MDLAGTAGYLQCSKGRETAAVPMAAIGSTAAGTHATDRGAPGRMCRKDHGTHPNPSLSPSLPTNRRMGVTRDEIHQTGQIGKFHTAEGGQLKTHWNRRRRLRWLLPIGAVASTLALVFGSTAPAYAAGYTTSTYSFYDEDPDGRGVAAIIRWNNDAGGSIPRYQAHFYPNGEMLVVRDDYADGHAAKVIVGVYEGTDLIDSDVFYVGTADTGRSINLGTPDGSGNIKDGLRVNIKLCINETNTCTDTAAGIA